MVNNYVLKREINISLWSIQSNSHIHIPIWLLHVFFLSQLPGRGVEFCCGLLTCNMSTSNSSSVPIGDNILIKRMLCDTYIHLMCVCVCDKFKFLIHKK